MGSEQPTKLCLRHHASSMVGQVMTTPMEQRGSFGFMAATVCVFYVQLQKIGREANTHTRCWRDKTTLCTHLA